MAVYDLRQSVLNTLQRNRGRCDVRTLLINVSATRRELLGVLLALRDAGLVVSDEKSFPYKTWNLVPQGDAPCA